MSCNILTWGYDFNWWQGPATEDQVREAMKRNEQIEEATAFLPEEASKETDSNVEDKREQQHDQDYSFIDHQDTLSSIHR